MADQRRLGQTVLRSYRAAVQNIPLGVLSLGQSFSYNDAVTSLDKDFPDTDHSPKSQVNVVVALPDRSFNRLSLEKQTHLLGGAVDVYIRQPEFASLFLPCIVQGYLRHFTDQTYLDYLEWLAKHDVVDQERTSRAKEQAGRLAFRTIGLQEITDLLTPANRRRCPDEYAALILLR